MIHPSIHPYTLTRDLSCVRNSPGPCRFTKLTLKLVPYRFVCMSVVGRLNSTQTIVTWRMPFEEEAKRLEGLEEGKVTAKWGIQQGTTGR